MRCSPTPTMSSLLPQYSKLPISPANEAEDPLLSESHLASASYPPPAPVATDGAIRVDGQGASSYQLPSAFCHFKVLLFDKEVNGVCLRGSSREARPRILLLLRDLLSPSANNLLDHLDSSSQETIENIVELFPDSDILDRDVTKIKFFLPSGPGPIVSSSSGNVQQASGWVAVNERFWVDLVLQGRPDRMAVRLPPNDKEKRQRQSLSFSFSFSFS